jgi:hypothetical protein
VRLAHTLLLISIGSVGPALSSGAAVTSLEQPTTAPSDTSASDEISGLIARLGDPDYRVRRDATSRLHEIGNAALPALREATTAGKPEVQARAAQIVRTLEYRRVPGRPRGRGRGAANVNLSVENGRRSIHIDDQGRQIKISQGPDGIEMVVTGELDGRAATETFRAKTPQDLRISSPEAFALYQRWAAALGPDWGDDAGGNFLILRGGNMIVIPAPPIVRAGGDDLAGLKQGVEDQMVRARLGADQRQRVRDALAEVEESRRLNAPDRIANPDQEIRRYEDACDDLRKALSDNKLPDPGEKLPPPKSARLGISVSSESVDDSGILVGHVLADSRADHIGLREDDVIRKINGADVHDVKELRRLVTEHARGLSLDITRDGKQMKLQEK